MQLELDLPKEIEDLLQAEWGDLNRAAKEALIIESYRTGKLSVGEVARLLGFETVFQAENWLGTRGVHWNYSLEDLESDRETLRTLFPENP